MNVLVIGQGGREHALAWKLSQSPSVDRVFCSPGNPGMREAECVGPFGLDECAAFAERNEVGLTVVGPEATLCEGIVDVFRRRGLRIFGPDQASARLEGSKTYAKRFMTKYGIPTARAESFATAADACAWIDRCSAPIVVKADGLAGGKGVAVANTVSEAKVAVRKCMSGAFGDAGREVLVEECLEGEEASILALVDGETVLPLATSQDHKRACDGDTGPNTGGMGAYSPAPAVDETVWTQIRERVLDRFLQGCRSEGLDYRGVIYAGIMLTEDGPKVLEFNVRFGDPETQAVLPRLVGDFAEALGAAVDRRLRHVDLRWAQDSAVCVVLASGGYPGPYEKGHPIQGIERAEQGGALVFHAGTSHADDGRLVTNGGRVLNVVCTGPAVGDATRSVYEAVSRISWPDMHYRTDIAAKALSGEK